MDETCDAVGSTLPPAPSRGREGGILGLICALGLAGCGAAETASRGDVASSSRSSSRACREAELAVQVLGSGGPILDDERASSGYLVWIDGRARLLVDLGPGAMLRLAETGAELEDLDALLLTHLHVDHSADLPGLLKTASFGRRRASLPVLGPTGDGPFPALPAFLGALLAEGGAYPYLGGYLGEGQPFVLEPRSVDVEGAAREVLSTEHLRVRAVGVPHGPVPALAYEVTVDGVRIAFMGDQRADEARYVDMIRGADLLVAHMAIGPSAGGVAARLHAPPARLGEVAAEAGVSRMVLSHLMRRSLSDLDGNLAAIRERYDGPVEVAEDGLCLTLR
jgi:ribonuclease BN (tRNA processing enzyme)